MLIGILAGLVCGVISGLGIGGGSILMVWLTAVIGVAQRTAQGINLLYFLPTAAASLIFHIKNRYVQWQVAIPAAICGCLTAAGAAFVAQNLDEFVLKRFFGIFLLFVGTYEAAKALKKQKT